MLTYERFRNIYGVTEWNDAMINNKKLFYAGVLYMLASLIIIITMIVLLCTTLYCQGYNETLMEVNGVRVVSYNNSIDEDYYIVDKYPLKSEKKIYVSNIQKGKCMLGCKKIFRTDYFIIFVFFLTTSMIICIVGSMNKR